MSSRRKLTVEERLNVVFEYQKLKNYSAVGRLFQISPEGVKQIIIKSREAATLADKPRSGRPRVTSIRDDRLMVQLCKRNPRLVVREIKEQLEETGRTASQTTIRRRLHDAKLTGHVARRKPLLTKVHKKRRLEFAKKYQNQPLEFWKKVIFSDESKFEIFGNRRRQTVWRSKGDNPYSERYLHPTVKHGGGGVMVWGCFSWFGVGNLHVIDGRMNAVMYCDILESNLEDSAASMGLSGSFVFQQDNDPKHTAKTTKDYFSAKGINLLDWPSMSPDLNPIEHLWDEIDRRIPTTCRKSKAVFVEKILETWASLPNTVLQKLVESMPKRIEAVLQNRGGHTKY